MTDKQPSLTPRLDMSAIGRRGAYYFLNDPTWIARHVETVEIESEDAGRRHLTIDIELPTDPEAVVQQRGDEALFCVPFALLAKHPPHAEIDVRSETSDSLPLLTRAENGWISSHALMEAFEHNVGGVPYPQFGRDLDHLVFASGPAADGIVRPGASEGFEAAVAAALMLEEIDEDGPGAKRIARVIQDLAVCSMLWIDLWGAPGERRIVKLSYAIQLQRQPLVLRRPKEEFRRVRFPDDDRPDIVFPVEAGGSIRWRDTAARLLNPLATALGWASFDADVSYPDVRGAHTYHLQVVAPQGLELTGIGIDACDGNAVSRCDGLRAHLYLSGIDGPTSSPIRVGMKVERRGFLNLSVVATTITAAGLWLAQGHAGAADDADVSQISAAVLLVLPALLAIFVARQAEHPIATRLLAGVRSLVLLAGLSSVTAAAALSGIRLDLWQTVSEAWIWCASIASVAAIGVTIAWLRSFDTIRPFQAEPMVYGPSSYLSRVGLSGLFVIVLCVAVRRDTVGLGEAEPLAIALLLTAAFLAAVVAVVPASFRARPLRIVCVVYSVAAIAAAGVTAVTHSDMRNDVVVVAGLVAFAALILALASQLRRLPQGQGVRART